MVICQHSHCIGCYENYENSTIVYGQGNFIFDYSNNEYWNTSLLIEISIEDDFSIDYVPIVKNDNCVRLANEQEKEKIISQFYNRSQDILKYGFIEKEYKEFAKTHIINYLSHISGLGKILTAIDRKILNNYLLNKIYHYDKLIILRNYIECEAHRELLLTGLDTKKKNNY